MVPTTRQTVLQPALTTGRLAMRVDAMMVKHGPEGVTALPRSTGERIHDVRTLYGPVHKAFAALDGHKQQALNSKMFALLTRFNRATSEALIMPAEYVEVVVTKA